MLKAKELKDMSGEELRAMLVEKRSEHFHLVNKREREKKLDNPHQIHGLKRDIARILTVLRQKELANIEGS
jgi:large subunit ribosomal protein L29